MCSARSTRPRTAGGPRPSSSGSSSSASRALDKSQNELKALKEQIEQQVKAGVAEKVLQERAAEYQKALIELQSKYMEYQRELAEQEARLTREIIARMERILRRIGQAEGYTMIVERNEGGVVWVPSNLDITDNVIQRYNAGEGREGEGGGGGEETPRPTKAGGTKRR
ncbi:MAG: OmpH family outer membrane protein [Sandaracinaceae bacterium]|nr:OmpH family outer membrane protein [Sandaracinaceae bacterium]